MGYLMEVERILPYTEWEWRKSWNLKYSKVCKFEQNIFGVLGKY